MMIKPLNPVEEDLKNALIREHPDDWPALVAFLTRSDDPDRREILERVMADVRPRLKVTASNAQSKRSPST